MTQFEFAQLIAAVIPAAWGSDYKARTYEATDAMRVYVMHRSRPCGYVRVWSPNAYDLSNVKLRSIMSQEKARAFLDEQLAKFAQPVDSPDPVEVLDDWAGVRPYRTWKIKRIADLDNKGMCWLCVIQEKEVGLDKYYEGKTADAARRNAAQAIVNGECELIRY